MFGTLTVKALQCGLLYGLTCKSFRRSFGILLADDNGSVPDKVKVQSR